MKAKPKKKPLRKVTDKGEALKTALKDLEKAFGEGAIMRMGDKPKQRPEVIPTGAINLDHALGIGGIPKGRIIELYGMEGSGKTTLALHIAAQCHKQGGTVAFIDAEHALDPVYAKAIGVDTEALLISQPDSGEQALEIVDTLVRSGAIDLIIVDSVAALVPMTEINGNMGDSHMGVHARLMSQALRKLTGSISKTSTAVIFINQLRMKIQTSYSFGPPETTTGGMALKFYSSMRIEVKQSTYIRENKESEKLGNYIGITIAKNKFAPPFKYVRCPLIYGKGISHLDIVFDAAVTHDIVKKSGSWYSYGSEKLGQGSVKAIKWLEDNPEILAEVEAKVRDTFDLYPDIDAEAAENDEADNTQE